MATQTIERNLFQSVPDGELYVVASYPDGTIIGACGPLVQSEIRGTQLSDYDMDPELGDVLQEWTEREEDSTHPQPCLIWKDFAAYANA